MSEEVIINRRVKALLDGRVACWRAYLGDRLDEAGCQEAALAFWGYPHLDGLALDYPPRPTDDEPWEIGMLPGFLQEALMETGEEAAGVNASQVLRDLMAYGTHMKVADFTLNLHTDRLSWLGAYDLHDQEVSKAVSAALCHLLGLGVENKSGGGTSDVVVRSLYGKMRVERNQFEGEDDLSFHLIPDQVIEYAGCEPKPLEIVRAFLEGFMAQKRVERTADDFGSCTGGHLRVRS